MDQSVVAKDGRQHSMVSYQDMTVQSGIEHHQPIQPTFPYSHFAVMYIDNRGEVQVEASPSITGYEQVIFPEEVQERFLKLASGEWQPDSQSVNPGMGLSNASWYHSSQSRASELIPYEWQTFQNSKRHRRNPRRVDSGVSHGWEPPSPSPSLKRSTLRVGQTKILRKYYEMAFECFQQLNCRVIAKAFVKLVEPRKQVNHPYNGRRTVAGSIQELNPELTKPKWWPSGVTHKEPDHLGKPERVRLLVHILCELRESHRITAERLKEAGQDVRRQITPGVRLQVLDEIYYVRGMEELYLDGKISGDTTIHVSHVHLEEELQEQMMKNSVGDSLVAMPAMRREQLPVPRSHQAIPTISKDTYHLPLRNSKRPVNSESYLPMSPSSSPSVSRKSSLERSMPTYAPEIDPAILSGPEPPRSPADPRGLQSADATSIPEFFANQFAAEPAGHNGHPAFWDAMPAVHPQFAFTSY